MAQGSIRKRGAGWQVRLYAGVDPVTGRKRWLERTVHGTKREAQTAMHRLAVELGHGTPTEGTFGYLCDQALAVATLSPTTEARYRQYLAKHILPAIGDVRLDRLTADQLDRLYVGLRRQGLSPASVQKGHVIVSRMLAQAVRWKWLPDNPAGRANPPAAPRPEIDPPAPADVARLIALAKEYDPDLWVYVRLAAVTGARRGELVALRWSDVDLAQGEVTIRRARVVALDGGTVERGTKTGKGRTIALDPTTVAIVDEHRVRCEFRAMTAETTIAPDGHLFTTADLEPWRPDGATSRFTRLRARAGLPNVRLHDLRHFAATSALAAGEAVRTVAGRLGHARASTTHDIYAHWVRESDRSTANALGRLLDEEP